MEYDDYEFENFQDEELEYEDLLRSKIKVNVEDYAENEEIPFSAIFNDEDEENPFY